MNTPTTQPKPVLTELCDLLTMALETLEDLTDERDGRDVSGLLLCGCCEGALPIPHSWACRARTAVKRAKVQTPAPPPAPVPAYLSELIRREREAGDELSMLVKMLYGFVLEFSQAAEPDDTLALTDKARVVLAFCEKGE